jgi:rsbT antagonist protein RsbS
VSTDRIPILKLGSSLIVSIQVGLHDRLAVALQNDLANQIVETKARGVLIDISALEVVDSYVARVLGNVASVASVLDADTVVVGMQPAVAITLVELGITLPGVRSALNIEKGMALIAPEWSRENEGEHRTDGAAEN